MDSTKWSDTGAAASTFPLNFGSDGAGDGNIYRTASGECISDGGAWRIWPQSIFEQKTHGCTQFLAMQDTLHTQSVNSTIGREMRIHPDRKVRWHGRQDFIAVYNEDNTFKFQLTPKK